MDLIKAGAKYEEGRSAQKEAERNASIDERNAIVAIDETKVRTLQSLRKGRSIASAIKAQAASSGFASGSGSSLTVQLAAIREAELESLEEQRIGLTEKGRLLDSASLNRRRGRVARRAGTINTLSSLSDSFKKFV